MSKCWVINASPLIVLARINQAHLFAQLADQIVVPQAVADEIHNGDDKDLARQFLDRGTLRIIATPPPTDALLSWDLGAGETAVLSYALANNNWVSILDDKAARKCARTFSLPIKGTLGVILLAKQQGLISSAADILRELRHNGFRLDEELIRNALWRAVNEVW